MLGQPTTRTVAIAEGEMSASTEETPVLVMLEAAELAHHAEAIKEAGYVWCSCLVEVEVGELNELVEKLNLGHPEARRLRKAIAARGGIGGVGDVGAVGQKRPGDSLAAGPGKRSRAASGVDNDDNEPAESAGRFFSPGAPEAGEPDRPAAESSSSPDNHDRRRDRSRSDSTAAVRMPPVGAQVIVERVQGAAAESAGCC